MRSSTSANGGRRKARKFVALVAALCVIVAVASGCESTDADRDQVLNLVNATRASNGLRQLKHNVALDIKADAWAQRLRDACSNLSHSKLSDGAPKEWRKLGENVGYGGTIDQVHDAYLNSPGHRANILDPVYTSMGTAAVWGDCSGQHRVFTVQVFMA